MDGKKFVDYARAKGRSRAAHRRDVVALRRRAPPALPHRRDHRRHQQDRSQAAGSVSDDSGFSVMTEMSRRVQECRRAECTTGRLAQLLATPSPLQPSHPYNRARDRPVPDGARRAGAELHAQRPAGLHGQAAGVGSSSEADAAAAAAHPRQAGAGQERSAQAGRSGEDAAAAAQPRAEGEVRGSCSRSTSATACRAWPASAPTSTCSAARSARSSAASPSDLQTIDALELPDADPRSDADSGRPRARHRPDRLRQVDHAGGDDLAHHRERAAAHRHHRGSDRVPLRRQDRRHLAARGRHRHAELQGGAAQRHAPGSRRDHGRRDARRRRPCETVLTAAETGHLVFSTLHTNNAAQTIDRIIDTFPADQHKQIRSQLALVLRGIISLKLVKTTDRHADRGGGDPQELAAHRQA